MSYSAGVAYLQIEPSFRDLEKSIRKQVADIGESIDRSISEALPRGMAEGAKKAKAEGARAGDQYAGELGTRIRKSLQKTVEDIPELDLSKKTLKAQRTLDDLRTRAKDILDQHIDLQVDDATALAAMRQLRKEFVDLNRTAAKPIEIHANTKAAIGELDKALAGSDRVFNPTQFGKIATDKFANELRTAATQASQELPDIRLKVNKTAVERDLNAVQRELRKLGDTVVGVDVSDESALRKLRTLQDRLQVLHDNAGKDLRLEADTGAALNTIDKFFNTVQARRLAAQRVADQEAKREKAQADRDAKQAEAKAEKAKAKADRDAKQATDKAERDAKEAARNTKRDQDQAERDAKQAARDAARNAQQAAAKAERDARQAAARAERDAKQAARDAAVAADRDLGGLARRFRDQLDTAATSIQKVDVNATPAEQKLNQLRADMERLRDLRVGVDIDAATAVAEIRRIEAELKRLATGTRDVKVRADVIAAYAALQLVDRLADKLDGRRVDLNVNLDDAARGVDKVATAAGGSLSRLGALIAVGASLGTVIVPGAAAAAVAVGAIATAGIAAVSGLGVAALAMFGIADAVKALNAYQLDANKSAKSLGSSENLVANALDGVAGAERALQSAREEAAFSARRAAQQVAQARRSVSDAEKDAVKAEEDLLQAMKDVRQAEEDRQLQLKDNALAQRQANLDLAEAKKALDKLLSNPRATQAERDQAQISYEERALQLEKLGATQKQLQAEQDQYNKQGVAGSDKVVAAQDRVAAANRSVADAQQNLTNAIEDQQRSQKQSANAILSATENLSQAQRTLAQSYRSSAVAGGEALTTLKQKMDALSPAGQRFALFIFGLKDEFVSLRDAASEGFLPGAQEAISNLLPYLPKVRDYISEVATAVGGIAGRVTESFGNPGWQKFFRFISDQTVPTLNGLATVTLNLSAGTRDLFLALTAFNKPIGRGLVDMSESFAKWAAQLEGSAGYRKFLAYVRDVGPDVVDFFLELGQAIFHIVEAAAPVGKAVLFLVDALLQFINIIPTKVLTGVIVVVALFAAGLLATTAATKLSTAAIKLKTGVLSLYTATVVRATTAWQGYSAVQSASLVGTGPFTRGLGATTLAVGSLSTAQANNAGPSQKMTTSVANLGAATKTTAGAMSGMAAFLGGPWGLAVIGAGVALTALASAHAEQQRRTEANIEAFKQLGVEITKTGSIQSDEARQTIMQSDGLKQLVLDLDKTAQKAGDWYARLAEIARGQKEFEKANALAGQSARSYATDLDTLAQAITGNKAAQKQLLDTLSAAEHNGSDEGLARLARERRIELEKLFAQEDLQVAVEKALADAQRGTGDAFKDASGGLKDYAAALGVLADASSTAAQKTDALRTAEDLLFGARRDQQEALEAQARALRERKRLLKDDNLLNQDGAKTLDIKTEAGAQLTDALEAELEAINATFRANIAANKTIEEATAIHDAEVEALRQAYAAKKFDHDATERLIAIYGQVPTSKVTQFSTDGFGTTMAQLDELMAYQMALREGISLETARGRLHPDIKGPGGKGNSQGAKLATGGPVRGPGTGTSDSVPAWIPETGTPFRLSDGEWVHKADAVNYYGRDFMKSINEKRLPRELLGMIGFGFAGGGLVKQMQENYPFPLNTTATRIPTRAEVEMAARLNNGLGPTGAGPGFLPWPSSPAAQRGDTGVWRSIVDLVRGSGIPYKFGNAYRPGDPLWHGSGRAVDFMGYNQDQLAEFFLKRQNQLLELIHLTSQGGYFVTRGKRKQNFPVQGPLHRNHLHVAMAEGGLVQPPQIRAALDTFDTGGPLMPGYTLAYNGTGRPEQVLTSRQMADVALMSKQAAAAGNAYHFQFRDTTLDASKLRAIQDREAALARTGRAR